MDLDKVVKVRLYMKDGGKFDIDIENFGDLLIQDISKDYLIGQQRKIECEEIAKRLVMEIHKRANTSNVFESIANMNLCAVGLGEKDKITRISTLYVNEKGKNKYQDTYKSELGHLYVTVDRTQKVLDIFDSTIINSPDRNETFAPQQREKRTGN